MCSLIHKRLLLAAYAYLLTMEQQKNQRGSEALQLQMESAQSRRLCSWLTGSRATKKVPKEDEASEQEMQAILDIFSPKICRVPDFGEDRLDEKHLGNIIDEKMRSNGQVPKIISFGDGRGKWTTLSGVVRQLYENDLVREAEKLLAALAELRKDETGWDEDKFWEQWRAKWNKKDSDKNKLLQEMAGTSRKTPPELYQPKPAIEFFDLHEDIVKAQNEALAVEVRKWKENDKPGGSPLDQKYAEALVLLQRKFQAEKASSSPLKRAVFVSADVQDVEKLAGGVDVSPEVHVPMQRVVVDHGEKIIPQLDKHKDDQVGYFLGGFTHILLPRVACFCGSGNQSCGNLPSAGRWFPCTGTGAKQFYEGFFEELFELLAPGGVLIAYGPRKSSFSADCVNAIAKDVGKNYGVRVKQNEFVLVAQKSRGT